MAKRQRRAAGLAVLIGVGAVLAGCTQPVARAGASVAVADIQSNTETVGSGAACIPDLNTTHISLVSPTLGGASGVISSASTAQQVREGAVPAPPNSRLVTAGTVPLQSSAAGAGAGIRASLGTPTIYLYETDCAPSDVRAFYVAALLQNQWLGNFTPASGAAGQGGLTPSAGSPRNSGTGANVTLFDFADLTSGRFVNSHPSGSSTAFIRVLAAIEAPGTPLERHPTYVEVIDQQASGNSRTPLLPPTEATTPNVGASAAPPATATP